MKIITMTLLICILSFGCKTPQKQKDTQISHENSTNNTNTGSSQNNGSTNTGSSNTNTSSSNTNTSTSQNTSNTNTGSSSTNTGTSQNTSSSNTNTGTSQNTGSSNTNTGTSQNTSNTNTGSSSTNTATSQSNTNTSSPNTNTGATKNQNTNSVKPTQDIAKIQAQIEQESSAIRKIYQSFGGNNVHPAKALKNFDFNKQLRFLVEQNAQDDRGYNMLMLASERGYVHTVKSILAINSQSQYVNRQSIDGGKTALMLAANVGSREIVRMLLLNGADPKIARDNGKRAVDFTRDEEIIGMLTGTQRY